MAIISLDLLLNESSKYTTLAQQGAIFVYPTDTIYGLGSIIDEDVIARITILKQRQPNKHYSIIAPNFSWIQHYFAVADHFEDAWHRWKEAFPERGITMLLPIKTQQDSAQKHYPRHLLSASPVIGVRVLDHPFQSFVTHLNEPFLTTSCNISGQETITQVSTLPSALSEKVDLIVDGGVLEALPSVIINYQNSEILRK